MEESEKGGALESMELMAVLEWLEKTEELEVVFNGKENSPSRKEAAAGEFIWSFVLLDGPRTSSGLYVDFVRNSA